MKRKRQEVEKAAQVDDDLYWLCCVNLYQEKDNESWTETRTTIMQYVAALKHVLQYIQFIIITRQWLLIHDIT